MDTKVPLATDKTLSLKNKIAPNGVFIKEFGKVPLQWKQENFLWNLNC